ncbi:winged helix-turn-helix domain-containing protein [Roseburia hominis]
MGGDTDGTIEIVMRIIKASGIVTETVLTSFAVKNIEQRVSVLAFSKLEIHLKEQVVYHSGELISMSHHEFFTLLYLAQHPGWVFSKKQIYEAVWKEAGDGWAAVTNVVSQIRRKIGERYIKTVIGSGYKFEV